MTVFQVSLTVIFAFLIAVALVAICVLLGIIASRTGRIKSCNCENCQRQQNDPIELDPRLRR